MYGSMCRRSNAQQLTPSFMLPIDELTADVLVLGAGGTGMLAALHVTTADPRARIVIAVKGLIGQSGYTRMVQGEYNSFICRHFRIYLHCQQSNLTVVGEEC